MKEESFMKRTKQQPYELSLLELLQEVQSRIRTETLPADQQPYVLQVVTDMLQACAKRVERPLPGQDMQEVRGQAHAKRAMEVAAAHPSFQTLQKIAEALGLPLVIILDGSKMNPDTVTIVSTSDVAEKLPQALQRAELVQLLLFCQQLNKEQVSAILGVARSICGFTQPLHEKQTPQEADDGS
jgi:hypothetical protein